MYVISKLCLRFSTIVCDTQFTLILFFLSFFGLMFNLKGPQGQNPRTACGPRNTVRETLIYISSSNDGQPPTKTVKSHRFQSVLTEIHVLKQIRIRQRDDLTENPTKTFTPFHYTSLHFTTLHFIICFIPLWLYILITSVKYQPTSY